MVRIFLTLVLLVSAGLLNQQVHAIVVVRMEIQRGATVENVDFKLFDGQTPLTVENFLKYVNGTTDNGGDYTNSFIHRNSKVWPYVLQGGGYAYFPDDPESDLATTGVTEIIDDDPVNNEFRFSNKRGTIAMARAGGLPDSATREWFVNLSDDNANPAFPVYQNLDLIDGGFTVFGVVMGNGMSVLDEIAEPPIYNKSAIHAALTELPLVNYNDTAVPEAPVLEENLIRTSWTEIFTITPSLSIKIDVYDNSSHIENVVINNTGTSAITFGNFDILESPLSTLSDTCSSTVLAVDSECMITIQYNSVEDTDYVTSARPIIELLSPPLDYELIIQAARGGIPPEIEDAGPNGGDANYDGILDSNQLYIESFPVGGGAYMALSTIVNTGLAVRKIRTASELYASPPSGITFLQGVIDFDLLVVPGGSATAGIIMPENTTPASYYLYGPTEDNIDPHWYEFRFDQNTGVGASIIPVATITAHSGETHKRSLVSFSFVDGGYGDSDMQANGIISVRGGPAFMAVDSGALKLSTILMMLISILALRYLHIRAVNLHKF